MQETSTPGTYGPAWDPRRDSTPDAHQLRLVSRALDDRYERGIAAAQRGEQMTALFTESLKQGIDMRLPLAPSDTALYPISVYLGECGKDQQALLFAAARLALQHKDREAAEALRVFVESVAREFGDGHAVEGE